MKLQLDKLYDSKAPEDDQRQRYEEMERMREHLMNEIDKDRFVLLILILILIHHHLINFIIFYTLCSDKMISMSEFIESTKKSDFLKNEGWEVGCMILLKIAV